MKFRPYISMDIETTGLDRERAQILEIAAVFDDLESPLDKLPTFQAKIHYDHLDYAEFYALKMNKELINELSRSPSQQENVMTFQGAMSRFMEFVGHAIKKLVDYESIQLRKYPDEMIHVAGKNVSSFDIPITQNQIKAQFENKVEAQELLEDMKKVLHFRYIDVGSLYMVEFNGYIPTLSAINQLIGREKVSHKALDDAFDVICAIRHKFGVPFKV